MPPDAALFAWLRGTHHWLSLLMFATFLLHLAAALFRGLVRRDGVLGSMASWRRKQAPAQPPDALEERRKRRKPRTPHHPTTPFPANPAVRWRPANETAHEALHGKHRRTPRKPAARLVQRRAAARGVAVGAGRQPHRRSEKRRVGKECV